ncbi:bro-3 [Sucra jujuba nucleopolyhedrovirus]|uniref:Bro-3 n=1 Tax=Sucra jujuba nucleopolyhedrovirus TaxID=1563660 RepID=A0A097P8Y4_9ABAC|nr:bro-3 [Sucra jujuba nucleopolyhedrovirus]AIU41290.1 bro-3 [Sucra jujuba nucleopolyhedrovirus]
MALSKQTFYLNDQPIEVTFIEEKIDNDIQFWFAAREFARCMGYERPDNIIHEKIDVKYRRKYIDFGYPENQGATFSIQPSTVFVNEPGLYQMVLSSKLKNKRVEQFKSWVFEVVLPTIRKNGRYGMNEDASTVTLLQTISQNVVSFKEENDYLRKAIVLKDEQLQQIVVHKDQQINRIMGDMNRMYTGFQEMMQKKDEIMQKKDEQVTELVHKVVDLSGRAVQYPVDKKKQPVLCVAREGTTFHAITGQCSYVEKQKNKRGLSTNDIILETKRPNPTVDWNNVVHEADTNFDKNVLKKKKRSLSFDSEDDAQQFENKLKYLLNLDLVKKQ